MNIVISFQNPPLLFLEMDMVCYEDYDELMIMKVDAVLIEYGFGQLNLKKMKSTKP